MSLTVAIQMDPIQSININTDSTFVLALEAQRRGHRLYHYLPQEMSLSRGKVMASVRALEVRREVFARELHAARRYLASAGLSEVTGVAAAAALAGSAGLAGFAGVAASTGLTGFPAASRRIN